MDWSFMQTVFIALGPNYVRITLSFVYPVIIVQDFHLLLMTVNRFTAIVFPIKYKIVCVGVQSAKHYFAVVDTSTCQCNIGGVLDCVFRSGITIPYF